ncbi:hypothetical protein BDM02DRAFT_3132393 [Thelephora ganbajun]|uniref:Uncharacterized protein n=1 Tax=Thelephora ganbajun TaxID=370292 RepID=A0ACB6Z1E3_THEGA|nr:hypothetical protein BDM02DRAFT_3132393 [Thelephora ganbajun]
MASFSINSSSPTSISPRHWAMIADEQATFLGSWNATTISHTRGSCMHPYPSPCLAFMRANTTENADKDFSDLGVNDFVLTHKVTAHHKLEHLQGTVFARSLLERGTYHAMEGIEVYHSPIEVSMGYTASVGIMLAEELALTNDMVGILINIPLYVGAISVTTRGTVARVAEMEETIHGLETVLRQLKCSHEAFKIQTELELANHDLSIGVLHACLNVLALMEVNLTTEEFISAPTSLVPSENTSTTDVSIRIETPDLVVPIGVLIPIEDEEEEEEETSVVPDERA